VRETERREHQPGGVIDGILRAVSEMQSGTLEAARALSNVIADSRGNSGWAGSCHELFSVCSIVI
jgi:hypothetical protein